MKTFDALIQRVTHRFEVDPELRAELAMELRTHLEESASTFEAAGAPAEQAEAQAVAALGDEQELSQQLWNANLRRLRLRSLIRWVGRLTLVPAAIVLVVFMLPPNLLRIHALQDGLASSNQVMSAIDGEREAIKGTVEIDEVMLFSTLPLLVANGDRGASIDARQILRQRVASRYGADSPQVRLFDERDIGLGARVLSARDDQLVALREHETYPLLHALHTTEVVSHRLYILGAERRGGQFTYPPPDLASTLDLIATGESLDPGRAVYNLLRAAVLLDQATQWKVEDKTLTITDAPMVERAMAQAELAVAKRFDVESGVELAQIQLQMLPSTDSVEDMLVRRNFSVGTILPRLTVLGQLSRGLIGLAAHKIAERDEITANQVLNLTERLADEAADSARVVIELLHAQVIKTRVIEQRVALHRAAGDEAAAQQVEAQLQERQAVMDLMRNRWRRQLTEAGRDDVPLVAERASLTSQIPLPQLHALRRAEYLMMDRAALSALAGLLLVVLLLRIVMVALARWRSRASTPTLVHLPWPRLVRLLLIALVAPLALYALYAWSPLGMRGYGLAVASEPTVLEYVLLGCIILTLLRIASWNEIARRARQLGLGDWPMLGWFPGLRTRPRYWLAPLVVGGLGGALAYLIAWRIGGRETFPAGFGYLHCLMLIAVTLAWWAADRHRVRCQMGLPSPGGSGYRLALVISSLVLIVLAGQPWSAEDQVPTYAFAALVLWLWLMAEFFIRFWHSVKLPSLRLYHHSTAPVIAAVLLTVTAITGALLRQAEAHAAGQVDAAVSVYGELEQTPYGQMLQAVDRQERSPSPTTTAPRS